MTKTTSKQYWIYLGVFVILVVVASILMHAMLTAWGFLVLPIALLPGILSAPILWKTEDKKAAMYVMPLIGLLFVMMTFFQ